MCNRFHIWAKPYLARWRDGTRRGGKGYRMAIEKVAIVGRGAVGLLHGTVIAEHLGCDAVEFVMDDERFARKGADAVMVNGSPCPIRTIPASAATPVDLVILAVKGPGLAGALDTMEPLVGPDTKIMSLLNGVMSEERVAERYGWERTVISITQGMDAVFIGGELTFSHPAPRAPRARSRRPQRGRPPRRPARRPPRPGRRRHGPAPRHRRPRSRPPRRPRPRPRPSRRPPRRRPRPRPRPPHPQSPQAPA